MSMSRAGGRGPPTPRLVLALRSRSDWTEAPHISGRAVSDSRVWPPPRLWGWVPLFALYEVGIPVKHISHSQCWREVFFACRKCCLTTCSDA